MGDHVNEKQCVTWHLQSLYWGTVCAAGKNISSWKNDWQWELWCWCLKQVTRFKSRAIWDDGRLGVGNGHNNPVIAVLELLFRAHAGHAETYSVVSCTVEGHQKHCQKRRSESFLLQLNVEAWAQWMATERVCKKAIRMMEVTDWPWWACFICSSISHRTAPGNRIQIVF